MVSHNATPPIPGFASAPAMLWPIAVGPFARQAAIHSVWRSNKAACGKHGKIGSFWSPFRSPNSIHERRNRAGLVEISPRFPIARFRKSAAFFCCESGFAGLFWLHQFAAGLEEPPVEQGGRKMRGDVTFRVIGVSEDGSRFVVGERFWYTQADLLRQHVIVSNKFSQILVEPDSGDRRREVRLGEWRDRFVAWFFGPCPVRTCLDCS
jgi:hypothetical protein